MEYCVTKRTGLLKNRHLDQVQIHVMIFKYARSFKVEKNLYEIVLKVSIFLFLNPQTGNIIHTLLSVCTFTCVYVFSFIDNAMLCVWNM